MAKANASPNLEVLPTSPPLAQTLPSDGTRCVEDDPCRRNRAATDGICIGPNVGSCGTAAYLCQPVLRSLCLLEGLEPPASVTLREGRL